MTNYERIKKMSVDEIADLLDGECCYCAYINETCTYDNDMHCANGIKLWLNSEVGE